jgi:hypothetical protein
MGCIIFNNLIGWILWPLSFYKTCVHTVNYGLNVSGSCNYTVNSGQDFCLRRAEANYHLAVSRRGYVSLRKSCKSSVQIMLMLLGMFNYSLLFLYPHDNLTKEEKYAT